jgi:hypothetical protein
MINESLMSLKYNAEKGAVAVGADKSITQCRMFNIVPELVAWDAEGGNRRCRSVWFATVTFVAVENDGWRIPGPSCMPSATTSSMCPPPRVSTFDLSAVELGSDIDGELADCAGTAEAFLRDLNENFFGGLNVLRVVWSFSDSVLMAYQSQMAAKSQ